MNDEEKWIVLLVGPPGAGKGTQAEVLAEDYGFYHFETSKIIEDKMNNGDPNDPILAREKKLFEAGKICTPEVVYQWVIERVRELAGEGRRIVFSGSPRSLAEAENELPVFSELYGKENVKFLHIEVSKDESVKRNSNRRICKAKRHPIPNFPEFKDMTTCPKDGSELILRTIDNPETVAKRYEEYLIETKPILDYIKKQGYTIYEIEGDQPIPKVHRDILDKIEGHHVDDFQVHTAFKE